MRKDMLVPQYIKKFRCIGSDCENTCCGGWNITVDPPTYKKYRGIDDYELKNKLTTYVRKNRNNINEYDFAKIKLSQGRCPFLLENELCEIHSKLGEEHLGYTCAVYPREYMEVDGVIEESLTISCPEAARLVLLNTNLMEFDQEEMEFPDRNIHRGSININPLKKQWTDYFWELRIGIIEILQNRAYTIEERLFIAGLALQKIDKTIQNDKIEVIPTIIDTTINNLNNGNYKGVLSTLPSSMEIQSEMCSGLIDKWYVDKQIDDKYKKCLLDVIEGLQLDEERTNGQSQKIYEKGCSQYYKPFLEEKEYIMENYLVNNVFKNCIPLDKNSPFESYTKLILQYALMKIHLIGIANKNGKLDEDKILSTMYLVERTYGHNKIYFEKLIELMKKKNFMSLAYLTILLKS